MLDAARGSVRRAAEQTAALINWTDWRADRPTVLCLDRALFRKDLTEMRPRVDLNLVTIGVAQIKRPQEAWMPPRWRRQTYITYDLAHDAIGFRRGIADFGRYFLEAAQRVHPIHAVLAANADYWQDEALRIACQELGIPFLVLSRENYGIAAARDIVRQRHRDARFHYNGAGIAVASPTCVQTFRESGSAPTARVEATGWPRYDAWADVKPLPPEQRTFITLLSYAAPLYWAQQNFKEVAEIFVDAAIAYRQRNPNGPYRFVVKMKKPNEADIHYDLCPRLRDAPVELTEAIPLPEIAPQSRILIGFNTLALLEALLGGGAVVVPSWADAERTPEQSLMHRDDPLDSKVAYFPTSAVEFRALLDRAVEDQLPAKGSVAQCYERFSRQSLLVPGIPASTMVEKFIRSFIDPAARAASAPLSNPKGAAVRPRRLASPSPAGS
jgi:hypothetical protein